MEYRKGTMENMVNKSFWKDKKVLITGHTGFKGSWMCEVLRFLGADVTGYALNPPTEENLFSLCTIDKHMNSVIGDIRDLEHLQMTFEKVKPEIVIHMAAQPIVRESYQNPVYTYETNVMGTVHVLECIRNTSSVKSFVNVTTDKVYKNREQTQGYCESDELNGWDPYSNSKSCSELVTDSYKNSYFMNRDVAISTARAGNVIGGGDFAKDRIIPDCLRAAEKREQIIVRNPFSIRPYQHVLEAVMAYLMLAERQYMDRKYAGNYNIGPDESDCITTGEIATLFCDKWNEKMSDNILWINKHDAGPHEAAFLCLDCSKAKSELGWYPRWNVDTAIEKTVEWHNVYLKEADVSRCMETQIGDYLGWK